MCWWSSLAGLLQLLSLLLSLSFLVHPLGVSAAVAAVARVVLFVAAFARFAFLFQCRSCISGSKAEFCDFPELVFHDFLVVLVVHVLIGSGEP